MVRRIVARAGSAGLAALLALSCSDPASPFQNVAGLWDYQLDRGVFGSTVCADTGSISLSQRGGLLSGFRELASTCTTAGTPPYSSVFVEADTITGTISGDTLVFTLRVLPGGGAPTCADTAIAQADSSLAITESCLGGAVRSYQARPGTALASVRVTPDSVFAPVGASFTVTAELRSVTGARVFGRAVSWSSDAPAVATAAAGGTATFGVVTGVGAGLTAVRAGAEGLSGSAKVAVPAPTALVAVVAGDAASCGLDAAGDVLCWGHGVAAGTFSRWPVQIGGDVQLTRLGLGHEFACGLTSAGAAYCWGDNTYGQLGNGTLTYSATPTAVSTNLTFAAISVGYQHVCALTAAGAAWCWGNGGSGRLGNGSTTMSTTPAAVSGGLSFRTISAGESHTCAITTVAFCWGDNTFGMLGDSTTTSRVVPTLVHIGIPFTAISAGVYHTCAVSTGGVAWCWGWNSNGLLGTADSAQRLVPDTVAGGHRFAAVAAGWVNTCALDAGGAAWCWGANYFGQNGDGTTTTPDRAPVAVGGSLTFTAISVGYYSYSDETVNGGTAAHSCGVAAGPAVYCWGVNLVGQVGDASTRLSVTLPVRVAGQP